MTVNYGTSIVTSGLQLLVDAANSRSYSGTGSTWTDLSGNAKHVTLLNTPTWNSLGAASYFQFNNGVSNQSATTTLNLGTAYTVSMTSLLLSNSSSFHTYWKSQSNLYPGAFATTNLSYFATNTSGDSIYTSPPNTSVIYDYSWTYDSTTATIYKNGILQKSGTSSGSTATGLEFASNAFATTPINLYRISIYNRALNATEVQTNFNAIRGRYGL